MKINTLPLLVVLSLLSCKGNNENWDATGAFEATEIIVSSAGNGKILSFNATEGQLLYQDSVIGLIDTMELGLQKMQLIEGNGTALDQRSEMAKQVAETEKQISWQKSEKTRLENLVALGAATRKQVDDIVNSIAALEKQLVTQHSSLENTNTDLIDQSVTYGQQISQVDDQIQKNLIKSPISGTLLVKYAVVGEFATIGKPLFSVADMNNIFLHAYITKDLRSKVKIGQKVKVSADCGNGKHREYEGTITWIADKEEFTPKNIQTHDNADMVYSIKIAVTNDNYLKHGMYGKVKL